MADDPEDLVLIFLRRLDRIAENQQDHSHWLTSLEMAVGNLAATEMSHYANAALRADRTDERLARIERRLDLAEAHKISSSACAFMELLCLQKPPCALTAKRSITAGPQALS